jgi:preprotein translocase SecF subunit
MFTALFVTRIIFAALVQSGIVKSLPMLRLLGVPDVEWIGLRSIFWPLSVVLVGGGAALFAFEHRTHKSNIYDIEFLGGSAVTIELQDGVTKTDEAVRMQINGQGPGDADPASAAGWLRFAAAEIESFDITPSTQAGVFEVRSQNLNPQQLEMVVKAGLVDDLEPAARGGVERVDSNAIRIATKLDLKYDKTKLDEGLARSKAYLEQAAAKLANAKVVVAWDSVEDRTQAPDTFDINTTETNKELVRQSIIAAMGGDLKIQNPVEYVVRTDPSTAPQGYYPIHREDISPTELRLAHIIGGETLADVAGYHGGVAMVFDDLRPPQTEPELIDRLHSARLLPEFEQFGYRPFKIVSLATAREDSGLPAEQRRLSSVAILVADENLVYEDDPVLWESELASQELNHAKAALSSQKTLQKVNQFAPQIASQMTQQAIMAILLAMVAIVVYVWIRFGNMHFGLAAIVALVHDVTLSLGVVAMSYYVFSAFGDNILLIRDFKIDLPMVAALLTIVGYSLNDTIVVFDRIRENRGKLKEVTQQMVNNSINQTLSRTVLTSITTLLAVLVMYIWGGSGIHGFSFAMIIGVVVGTYSSVAIATPLLLHPNLLKWIINAIIAVVLVGLAWSMEQQQFQILFWILAGLFGAAVLWNEIKRGAQVRPGLARGTA